MGSPQKALNSLVLPIDCFQFHLDIDKDGLMVVRSWVKFFQPLPDIFVFFEFRFLDVDFFAAVPRVRKKGIIRCCCPFLILSPNLNTSLKSISKLT